jgi:hypothetical protein
MKFEEIERDALRARTSVIRFVTILAPKPKDFRALYLNTFKAWYLAHHQR